MTSNNTNSQNIVGADTHHTQSELQNKLLEKEQEAEKFRSCVFHLNAIVQALEESDALCHDSNFRTAMAKAEKAIFNGNREIQKSPIFQRAWEQSLVEDLRTPADAREARNRVLDGGRSETLFAEIHGHELTKYQQLDSRFEEVVRAWTDQKQKITNQQQEIDWMRREAAEWVTRNQSLREGLNESEAQVDFLENQRFEWRNRTEDAEREAEEARVVVEAANTRHSEEIEKYRVCCNNEIYEREKTIAHLRGQIDGNHRQFAALEEVMDQQNETIGTIKDEDRVQGALADQAKRIGDILEIAERSRPDPCQRSSQAAGFALLQLDKAWNDDPTMWQSDEEDALPRVPRPSRHSRCSPGPATCTRAPIPAQHPAELKNTMNKLKKDERQARREAQAAKRDVEATVRLLRASETTVERLKKTIAEQAHASSPCPCDDCYGAHDDSCPCDDCCGVHDAFT